MDSYKEALERAKTDDVVYDAIRKVCHTDEPEKFAEMNETVFMVAKEAVVSLFPELRESEDERIRKKIITIVKNETGWQQEFPSQDQCLAWLEKHKSKMTAEEFENLKLLQLKLKEAKENKYVRVQLLWELMHNGIITEVDYMYLTDDKRKPWTAEEYHIAYKKGFAMSEQLKQKEQKPLMPEEKVKHPLYIEGFEAGKEVGAQCEKVFKEQKPTPDWMPKFLDELRTKSYLDWDEHRDMESKVLAIINWIAPDYFEEKEKQKEPETTSASTIPSCWEEKQKEQRPAQTEEEREYVKTLKGLVSDFVRDCGGDITDIGYYQRICDWLDGRHIEQKPDIEICPHSIKSKSYKENGSPIESCDYGLEIAETILERTLGKVEGYQSDDGIREHQTALQAVKDAMKEQQPVNSFALSKDGFAPNDTFRFNLAATLYNYGKEVAAKCLDTHILDEELNEYVKESDVDTIVEKNIGLLQRNARHMQQSAEWSEEDEKTIDEGVEYIEKYAEYVQGGFSKQYVLDLARRVDSLRPRPHWKPSEEEMTALGIALNLSDDSNQTRPLSSLLENLRKIK